jgi:hypothetical protein
MNTQVSNTLSPEAAIQPRVKLYTLNEAAKLLRRKPNSLYTKTKENSIPHRRFGKYIVFAESDIDTIIAMSLRGPGEVEKVVALEGQLS